MNVPLFYSLGIHVMRTSAGQKKCCTSEELGYVGHTMLQHNKKSCKDNIHLYKVLELNK